jgi:hypothetical protein
MLSWEEDRSNKISFLQGLIPISYILKLCVNNTNTSRDNKKEMNKRKRDDLQASADTLDMPAKEKSRVNKSEAKNDTTTVLSYLVEIETGKIKHVIIDVDKAIEAKLISIEDWMALCAYSGYSVYEDEEIEEAAILDRFTSSLSTDRYTEIDPKWAGVAWLAARGKIPEDSPKPTHWHFHATGY